MRIRGESLHCVIKMGCWQVVSFVCVGELLELGKGGLPYTRVHSM